MHSFCAWTVSLALSLMIIACGHWRDSYLDDGVGTVTQAEVREKLGKPHITEKPLLDEDTTWIYRYALTESEMDPWGFKSVGKGISAIGNQAASIMGKGPDAGAPKENINCFRYVLNFDQAKVLRTWNRGPC